MPDVTFSVPGGADGLKLLNDFCDGTGYTGDDTTAGKIAHWKAWVIDKTLRTAKGYARSKADVTSAQNVDLDYQNISIT